MRKLVNGFKMAYTDAGKGLPVVMVHGYPLCRKLWEPQVNFLAKYCRIIAVDLRGHGDSDPIKGSYSIEQHADDIKGLLDVLKINNKVVICGLSMGGYITLAFIRKYASRTAGIVLTATRAGEDSPQGKAAREQTVEIARSQGVEVVIDMMLPKMFSPENFTTKRDLVQKTRSIMTLISLEGMVSDLIAMKERPDSRPFLADISIPTFILHGEDDQLILPQEPKDMQAAIQNAHLILIPNAGHLLNLEQPSIFNAALRDFITSINSDR